MSCVQEDPDDMLDPFTCHLQHELSPELLQAVSASPPVMSSHQEHWPCIGQLVVQLPVVETVDRSVPGNTPTSTKLSVEEERVYTKPGTVPKRVENVDWTKLFVRSQIRNNITKANFLNLKDVEGLGPSPLTALQKELFSIVNSYQDLYFQDRTLRNGEEVRFVYCLHAVNHVLKTRLKIIHHNAKISRRDNIVSEEFRDQGLVRPKVLIVVPFKESALRVVKMIIEILLPDEKANILNKKRFFDEFSGNELVMPKKNPKPEDYETTFTGNTDDTFRIGISVTKKSLRLYADFYSADIIIASPLGLRVIVGAEGESERDFDFLASIEVLILDQLEIFFMQNWDHLLHVLDHVHLQPRDSHGTDFSRVRSWAVNGWGRYYRQTLLFSALRLPEFSALFNRRCHNYAGKVRAGTPATAGTVCQVMVQLPQVFQKLDANSAAQAIEARFEYFTKKILPQYKDAIMNHVLIFVPSYFDYVRLRNYLKREDMSFVQICEYSKEAKIARARDMFFHDDAHFLLYSERFHFFRRLRIKGIRHILFYQPPTFPHFYSEMCNLMHEANQNSYSGSDSNMTVTVLYTKYDVQQLAAVVGTERAGRMVLSDRSVHLLMTEGS
ncbi:U3 small nucleolar RNA-associated protein 25 homolog isoform X2 [Bacillus rossius redtenbacheri]|uniref:U3 small nucleolar RNA-associated protein 25 homolog isoform X2 n=1 Tax=Bacillus rossius redtenbacheri TaxID=93214 RepID=UPI002FDD2E6E